MDECGVLLAVRADLHEDEAGAVAAEAVLEDDEGDENERGAEGDERGGDEQAVAAAGFCEDKEVHRADKDAEGDEDDDEKDVVEGFLPEGVLERPDGGKIIGHRLEACFDGTFIGEIDGFLGVEFEVGANGFDEGFAETGIGWDAEGRGGGVGSGEDDNLSAEAEPRDDRVARARRHLGPIVVREYDGIES